MDYTSYIFSLHSGDGPKEPRLVDADQTSRQLYWSDYVSAVKRIAVGLQSLGVAEQDGVGLLSYNDIYYYVLGDGAIAAGAAFAGIPTFAKQRELATAIEAAGIKWLVVSPEFLDLAQTTVESLGLPLSMLIVFDPPGRDAYTGPLSSISGMLASADETQFINVNEGRDVDKQQAFRLFTSGSTGSVKAAVLSHRAHVARLEQSRSRFIEKRRTLHIIGMYHISGILSHNSALVGGDSVYVSRATETATVVDRIASLKIVETFITPYMMEDIVLAQSSINNMLEKFASLNTIFFSGAPCRQVLIDRFRAFLSGTARLGTGYGMTELVPISYCPVDEHWKTGQVGYLTPTTQMRIIDPETLEQVPPGGVGEICLRSVCLFSGYYNNEAATRESFLPNDPEWFRTGDKGFAHPETGFLTLVGRYKQIFKVRYEEVAPAEVEGELLQHTSIADALVTSTVARDDEKGREALAYVVPLAKLTAQEVVDFVASRLAAHKVPTGGVVFCDKIPRGAMGKPLAKEMDAIKPLDGSARFLTATVV